MLPMLFNKYALKKTRPKNDKWTFSICAVVFLLLAATCFVPLPEKLGPSDSIRMHDLNGLPSLAVQNHRAGSIALSKALRTGNQLLYYVRISYYDLTIEHFPPSTIEWDHAGSPGANFLISNIKVRAPPLCFLASAV